MMINKLKRAVVLGLAAITLFTGTSAITVNAAECSPIHTTVDKTGKKNNQKITYKVVLDKTTITDGQVAVCYDPEVLELKSNSCGIKFADSDVNKDYAKDEKKGVSYAFIEDAPKAVKGNLMTLQFAVKKNVKADRTIISTKVFGLNNDGEDVVKSTELSDEVTVGREALKKPSLNGVYQTLLGVHVNWSKDKNADGYIIYKSTSKNGKYSKVATVRALSDYLDLNVKNKTTYYYKLVAFEGSGKNRVYSEESNIKSIKVNKFFGIFN